jgi:hypothetical protein
MPGMKKDELWLIFVRKNPRFGDGDDTTVTLTVRGLKKMFDTAFERGHDHGFENGKAWESATAKTRRGANDLFSQMFGGKA